MSEWAVLRTSVDVGWANLTGRDLLVDLNRSTRFEEQAGLKKYTLLEAEQMMQQVNLKLT